MVDRRDFLKLLTVCGSGAALLKSKLAFGNLDIDTQSNSNSNKRINILFDSWSSQVMFQRRPFRYPRDVGHPRVTRQRLNTILGAMKSYGFSLDEKEALGMEWNVRFTNSRIKPKHLKDVDVYVSLTRYLNSPNPPASGTGYSYKDFELAALEDFVSQGGGILLMTDHGAFSERDPGDDWTENDAALASVFGVTLRNIFVTADNYMLMEMKRDLPEDMRYLANQVFHISSHDSCIMEPPPDFTALVEFPEGATAFDIATDRHIPLPNPYFSILVPFGAGNVIVVGNSGMVGDYGSPSPAPGIVNLENNMNFFLNCVSYLAGYRCIPDPGQGPCRTE